LQTFTSATTRLADDRGNVQHRAHAGFEAAVALRDRGAKCPGLGQRVDDDLRDPAVLLALGCMLADQRLQRAHLFQHLGDGCILKFIHMLVHGSFLLIAAWFTNFNG
jgi:hypothetical protein